MTKPTSEKLTALEKDLQSMPRFRASIKLRLKLAFQLYLKNIQLADFAFGDFSRGFLKFASASTMILILGLSSITSYAYLSPSISSSTPLLGRLKLASENVQLAFADDTNQRLDLQLSFAKKRVNELGRAVAKGDLSIETLREASYKALETLQLAKQADSHTKVATAKNLAQISEQALGTSSELKNKLVSEKALAKASEENLSEEILREIKYQSQGIILGPTSVAANVEPSLELTSENKIVTKDLYIMASDPRDRKAEEAELSPSSLIASQIIDEVSQDPDLQELDKVIVELKNGSDLEKLASELEIIPEEEAN